jgi:tRNA(His) 5'-end guanylyltransferase
VDSLGDRMKHNYEDAFKIRLPLRMPVIIRLDGKAFHSIPLNKPFDNGFIKLMNDTAIYLCENIQGVVLAYIQSDEISLLIHNYKKIESQAWFDNEIQKMVSISASLASSKLTNIFRIVQFDSRAFIIPETEVCNYFIWRQKDWERNSIQMLAQSLYSHKQLHLKNCSELQEMCFLKNSNWNDLPISIKRGRCCIKNVGWEIDNNMPILTQDRNYIESLLRVQDEP